MLFRCPQGIQPTLDRVRDVLGVVLQHSGGAWPSLEEWARLLPTWFVAACSDDLAGQTCVVDRWSLRAWIYWFEPERRGWRWGGVETSAPDRVRVLLVVESRPYLRGALEWLFRVAGAVLA